MPIVQTRLSKLFHEKPSKQHVHDAPLALVSQLLFQDSIPERKKRRCEAKTQKRHLWTDLRAVHDRLAAIELVSFIQLLNTFVCELISAIHRPSVIPFVQCVQKNLFFTDRRLAERQDRDTYQDSTNNLDNSCCNTRKECIHKDYPI